MPREWWKSPGVAAALLVFSLPALSQTPTVARVVPAFGPAAGSNIVIVTGTGFLAGATVTFGGVPATSVAVASSTSLTAHPPAHFAGSVAVSVSNPGGSSGSLANTYKYLAPSGQFGIQFLPVSVGAVTDIAAGPDGNLWLLNNGGESLDPWSISRMTTSGVFTNYPLFDPGQLTDIALGPDGNLWYARVGPDRIGRMTPAGVTTEFSLGSRRNPLGVTAGPDGAVWFTEHDLKGAGRITTGGAITEYAVSVFTNGITLGPDGALWIAGCANAGLCGSLRGAQFQQFPTPNPAPGICPEKIVAGPDANLWFQYSGRLSIGRLTTAGVYAEFPVPTGITVHDIAAGVDGNLWFTNSDFVDAWVGRITPSGQVTTFALPIGSVPRGIAAGPDGALWFADGYDVGRINPGAPAPSVTRVTPSFGPDAGGTLVTLLGSGFLSGATVSVGGVPATSVTVVDPTTITATTGPHVAGTVDVTVTNPGPQILTLPGSFFYAPPPGPSRFFPLPPCRILDTRNANGPHGGPALEGNGARRTFVLAGSCAVPADAKTVSANVTVTGPAATGSLTCFPGNAVATGTTSIAFRAGVTRANNAMLYLATDGAGSIGVQNDSTGSVHFIVDVNGYFR